MISRAKILTFIKAYELKYDVYSYLKFKIDISDDNLRDWLDITVNLNSKIDKADTFFIASCLHRQIILSCVRDIVAGPHNSLQLYFQKNMELLFGVMRFHLMKKRKYF